MEEDVQRQEIFWKNLDAIDDINRKELGYKCKMNKFGHLTDDEFSRHVLNQAQNATIFVSPSPRTKSENRFTPIDWRTKGAVSSVKNQGHYCGSCYAFSAVGAIEGQISIKYGKLENLSAQHIVDCSSEYGNGGCFGGLYSNAFDFAMIHGISTENDYPYTGSTNDCADDDIKSAAYVYDYGYTQPEDDTAIQNLLLNHGPLSVAINADPLSFRFYESGIYSDEKCNPEYLDHAVLLVGMGSEPEEHYIIKNSWSKSWGDNGYMKMKGNGNTCGVLNRACYVTIK